MIFKVIFGKQIYLIKPTDKPRFEDFLSSVLSTFKALPNRFTFSYLDEDGDEITLKNQSDYEVLLGSGAKTAKITIRETNEDFMEVTNVIPVDLTQKIEIEEEKPAEKMVEEQLDLSSVAVEQPEFTIEDSMIEEKLKKLLPEIVSKIKSEITE
jgi:hypothetical protein